MPFEIVRNDITNMKADAIVNAANPRPVIGYGVDSGIHQKAGHRLLKARKEIGDLVFGQAAVTPAFSLSAKYVIHTATPVWRGGSCNELSLLRDCYENALRLALEYKCKSIIFPLLSAGNHGFPKDLALQTAISAFSTFLMEHDMQITLAVFDRSSYALSEKLFTSVKSYIDETYILAKGAAEYGRPLSAPSVPLERLQREETVRCREPEVYERPVVPRFLSSSAAAAPRKLEDLMKEVDDTFSETLIRLIDRKGLKDSDVYKKANIDRKLFSKIKNNKYYRPGKNTALAFAIALELSLDETKDFIGKAGYALTHSSKFDIIIEYFLLEENYDIFEINETLFAFDQPLIGA